MSSSKLLFRAVAVTSLALTISLVGPTASAAPKIKQDVHVVGIDQKFRGQSYGEWSAAWWQWAWSIPADESPLFDDTGANCAQHQSGTVWFLAGSFAVVEVGQGNFVAEATRACTIPPGTALFFPILNAEADNSCPPRDPPAPPEQLRAEVNALLDQPTEVAAELDGVPVQHVVDYRAASPVFQVVFPPDNICGTTPGTSIAVADGYYLMLKPLSAGEHVLHFTGSIPGFSLDITYHLTVGR